MCANRNASDSGPIGSELFVLCVIKNINNDNFKELLSGCSSAQTCRGGASRLFAFHVIFAKAVLSSWGAAFAAEDEEVAALKP